MSGFLVVPVWIYPTYPTYLALFGVVAPGAAAAAKARREGYGPLLSLSLSLKKVR